MKLNPSQYKVYNPYNIRTLADLAKVPDDYHAILAPSSMGRVLKCPASLQESLEAPVKPPSEAALRGTWLHEVIAGVIEDHIITPTSYHMKSQQKVVVKSVSKADEQQVLFCFDALKYWLKFYSADAGYDILSIKLEAPGTLEAYGLPFIHGTADVVITIKRLTDGMIMVFVLDWKFGFVEVYTEYNGIINPQLMLYGLMQMGKADGMFLSIVQPAHSYNEVVQVSHASAVKWLNEFFVPTIVEAMGPNPRFNPGIDQCRFCPAGMTCRVRKNKMDQIIAEAKAVKLKHVTTEELVVHFNAIKEVKKYFGQIEKHLLSLALDGEVVPTMKVVNGRGTRSFIDTNQAEMYMLDNGIDDADLYKSKLISPAQAEKLNRRLKKDEEWKNLIELKPGKPQLVLDEDKRQAIDLDSSAEKAFQPFIE